MTSTRQLEDTLPLTAPPVGDGDFANRKIDIYTTLPLDTMQLKQLEQDLREANDIEDTNVAKLASQPHFNSLLDIYNHHIRTRDQETSYDPRYFITADQEDWAKGGVLFVNLIADTEQRESFVGGLSLRSRDFYNDQTEFGYWEC